jgi:hypothetical protein
VPAGPALSTDERRHVIGHLQAVAERASRRDPDGLLLRRQAYYLTGFDQAPGTRHWLAQMHRADQRALRSVRGWSVTWPLARSAASALTRVGDPEPMRRVHRRPAWRRYRGDGQPELLGALDRGALNIHSLWALIRVRPELAPPLAAGLETQIVRLLDENQVPGPARRELEALRYGIAIARRN